MNAKKINSILKEESKRLCNSGLVLQDFGNFSIKIDDNILILFFILILLLFL